MLYVRRKENEWKTNEKKKMCFFYILDSRRRQANNEQGRSVLIITVKFSNLEFHENFILSTFSLLFNFQQKKKIHSHLDEDRIDEKMKRWK